MAEYFMRSVSPDSTRTIWTAITALEQNGQPPTVEAIIDACHGPVYDADEFKIKVIATAECGLTVQSSTDDGTVIYGAPQGDPQSVPEPSHDWYCFECHGSGHVIGCTSCFRVYHPVCLSLPEHEDTPIVCPVCTSVDKTVSIDQNVLMKQLDDMLLWVHDKGGPNFTIPLNNAHMSELQYRTLIARHMDLAAMRGKLTEHEYANPRQFLADFQLLVHNIYILYGKDSQLSNIAMELMKQVVAEVETLEIDAADDTQHVAAPAGSQVMLSGQAAPPIKRRRRDDSGMMKGDDEYGGGGVVLDDALKRMLMDLQRHWLLEYQQSREKMLVELTEKLHLEFLSDQQKIRTELLTQFKDELDATRQELEQKYRDTLKAELQRLSEKHRKETSNTKKKQWCWQCESEAIYWCCWNTAYCSQECQQSHWPTHRKYCRRKKQAGGAPGNNN